MDQTVQVWLHQAELFLPEVSGEYWAGSPGRTWESGGELGKILLRPAAPGGRGLVWDGHGKEQEEEKFKDLFSKNDKLPNTIQTDKGTEFLFKDTMSLILIEKQPLLNVSLELLQVFYYFI